MIAETNDPTATDNMKNNALSTDSIKVKWKFLLCGAGDFTKCLCKSACNRTTNYRWYTTLNGSFAAKGIAPSVINDAPKIEVSDCWFLFFFVKFIFCTKRCHSYCKWRNHSSSHCSCHKSTITSICEFYCLLLNRFVNRIPPIHTHHSLQAMPPSKIEFVVPCLPKTRWLFC